MRAIIRSDAPASFLEVTDVIGELEDALIVGDILVDWTISDGVYDIIRRRSMIVHYAYYKPQLVDLEAVGAAQAEAIIERRWIYKRVKGPNGMTSHRILVDPNGRAFVSRSKFKESGVLAQFGTSRRRIKYPSSMEPWWAAIKAFHGRLWEVTEGTEVASKDYKEAARLFITAHKKRKALGVIPIVGDGAVLRKGDGSPEWWDRFRQQLDTWKPPDIDKSRDLLKPRTKKVLTGSREVAQLMLWMSWREWDIDHPPIEFEPLRK